MQLYIITKHEDKSLIGTIGRFEDIEEPDKLPCDGRIYSPGEFPELFEKVGTEFGFDGQPRLPRLPV